jgi:hypothetical protein
VFEEYEDNIQFPIPFVTDYVRYDLDSLEHLRSIGQILYDSLPTRKYLAPEVIQCPYSNCNSVYSYWSALTNMHCPVCRQEIEFGEPTTEKVHINLTGYLLLEDAYITARY